MASRATFADPARTTVNLWMDADSVRPGLPLDDPDVLAFINGGGVVGPYETPPPPPTSDQLDTKALNEALVQDGSVVRALAEVMFLEINKLRVKTGDAAYTKAAFVAALKGKMRNGT